MRRNKPKAADITGEMTWAPTPESRRKPSAREHARHKRAPLRTVDLTPEEERIVVQGLRHILIGGYNATAAQLLQRLMGVG